MYVSNLIKSFKFWIESNIRNHGLRILPVAMFQDHSLEEKHRQIPFSGIYLFLISTYSFLSQFCSQDSSVLKRTSFKQQNGTATKFYSKSYLISPELQRIRKYKKN